MPMPTWHNCRLQQQCTHMVKYLTQYMIVRYVVAGGTSATVDLSLLYLLNDVLHLHYLPAAILAFCGAFGVSFVLHKFWTFKNASRHKMHHQVGLYLLTSLFGLLLNTLLMYIFVSHLHFHVLIAQVIVGLLVACCTFFLSRNIVFKHRADVLDIP